MARRLEKLEEQIQKLSELVRDHAEDMDRLVRIVAENQDVVRLQLLRKHQEKVRVRKHLREANSEVD
jgi:DNA repair ATPase RecN